MASDCSSIVGCHEESTYNETSPADHTHTHTHPRSTTLSVNIDIAQLLTSTTSTQSYNLKDVMCPWRGVDHSHTPLVTPANARIVCYRRFAGATQGVCCSGGCVRRVLMFYAVGTEHLSGKPILPGMASNCSSIVGCHEESTCNETFPADHTHTHTHTRSATCQYRCCTIAHVHHVPTQSYNLK
jgi:hypothetical protein